MIHKNKRHLPRYWKWYDDHLQRGFVEWAVNTRLRWTYLTTVIKPFLKGWSSTMILLALDRVVHFVDPSTSYLINSLLCTCGLIHFRYLLLPLYMSWWDLIYPFPICLSIFLCLSSLFDYRSPEVQSWSSNLTLDTTKLVGSLWNIISKNENITQFSLTIGYSSGKVNCVCVCVGKTLTGYKKGRPLPVLPRMGRPPSSAPQNQTSTSTWNSTSYT